MQVDPIKPKMNAPGTKRLKLKSDEPLSSFAFEFNLRRYIQANLTLAELFRKPATAGAYTRPLLSSQPKPFWNEPFCVPFVTSYGPSIY